MNAPNLEETAKQIFGADDPAAVAHWVNYWNRGYERNLELLQSFEEVLFLDLAKQRVLDAGCGVGSMGEVLRERCSHYVGVDLNHHVLRFASPEAGDRTFNPAGCRSPSRNALSAASLRSTFWSICREDFRIRSVRRTLQIHLALPAREG